MFKIFIKLYSYRLVVLKIPSVLKWRWSMASEKPFFIWHLTFQVIYLFKQFSELNIFEIILKEAELRDSDWYLDVRDSFVTNLLLNLELLTLSERARDRFFSLVWLNRGYIEVFWHKSNTLKLKDLNFCYLESIMLGWGIERSSGTGRKKIQILWYIIIHLSL